MGASKTTSGNLLVQHVVVQVRFGEIHAASDDLRKTIAWRALDLRTPAAVVADQPQLGDAILPEARHQVAFSGRTCLAHTALTGAIRLPIRCSLG